LFRDAHDDKQRHPTPFGAPIGASISPILATTLVGTASLASLPFCLAGGTKVLYDLLLYRSFKAVQPPEGVG
jgi:hypothetical protein